uniref:B-cell lymphoma/leukemia 10 n=1 Tax=Lepisosteus oculatus TaxID=7918 RepID=W5MRM7_LEPOC
MDIPQLTEDEMAEVKKEALERLRPYLCAKIIADRHFDFLRSRKILTKEDTEDINCRVVNSKKTGKMLDYVADNPNGLDSLVESIQRMGTKDFIIQKITKEIEKVKHERIESVEAGWSCGTSPGRTHSITKFSHEFGYDKDRYSTSSTLLYHSAGQWSTDLPTRSIVTTTNSLPKPGDSRAPPLLEDL